MSDGDPAPAPLPLRWVEELVNTRSVEFGTDDVAAADDLAAWLQERDLLPPAVRVTPAAHLRALRVREGLRALIAANNDGGAPAPVGVDDGVDPQALVDLGHLAQELPLVLDVTSHPARLASRSTGTVDAGLAALLAAVAGAIADGSWSRMKACRDPGCRWAYFDHSRNRSRAWCSMALCGNRAKARAFRRRGATLEAGEQDA